MQLAHLPGLRSHNLQRLLPPSSLLSAAAPHLAIHAQNRPRTIAPARNEPQDPPLRDRQLNQVGSSQAVYKDRVSKRCGQYWTAIAVRMHNTSS